MQIPDWVYKILKWSERYTRTDMVYFMRNNFWLTGGRVIAVGSGFLLTISFANFLTPTQFGTYKYVLAAAGFIVAFSLSGLGTAVVRAVAQGKKNVVRHVFRQGVLWSIPASIGALAIAAYYFSKGNEILGAGFLLISLTNPFNNLGISKAIFQGIGDFKGQTLYSIPRTVVPILLLIGTLFLTQNLIIILAVYFFSNLLAAVILYQQSLKRLRAEKGDAGVEETMRYGKHMSVLGFFSQSISQIDQLLLWHFVGPVGLATYTFALAPVRELRNLSENFFAIIFPRFASKTLAEGKQSTPLRTRQLLVVAAGMATAYIIIAPFVFKIFFPQYMGAVLMSQIFALSLVFMPRGVVEMLLIAHGGVKYRYISILGTQITRLSLFAILIPLFGVPGAIAAGIATEAVSSAILFFVYKKI